jgi:hypothetical protein
MDKAKRGVEEPYDDSESETRYGACLVQVCCTWSGASAEGAGDGGQGRTGRTSARDGGCVCVAVFQLQGLSSFWGFGCDGAATLSVDVLSLPSLSTLPATQLALVSTFLL